MSPERYRRINELADALLDMPAENRTTYLTEACAGDDDLQHQVARLVEAHSASDEFLAAPAIARLAPEFVAPAQTSAIAGRRIGRYEILSRLGAGGHGEVWLAMDEQLSRHVAVKLLSPEYASHPAHVQRLYMEARVSSALNHPNIVTIYDTGEADGAHFIAQEYVAGDTLRRQLANGPLNLRRALNIANQIASALEAAHAAGVVHRDIKPENVMVRPDGLVKVLDFGLARFSEDTHGDSADAGAQGARMGTLKYMAPEQVRGASPDSRSDVFSFGVVLYEMLAGQNPFSGSSHAQIVLAVFQAHPEPLSRRIREVPVALDAIVSRCLKKDPEQRYRSGAELRHDLQQFTQRLDAVPAGSRRQWFAAFGTAAGVAAGFAVYRSLPIFKAPAPFERMNMTLFSTPGVAPDGAISPDGSKVAYFLQESRGLGLWIRELSSARDRRILAPETRAYKDLTFAPDGGYLYFSDASAGWTGTLYRVPVSGGAPTKVLEYVTGRFAFSSDGRRFAYIRLDVARWEESLVIVNADGSAERTIATRRRPRYFSRAGLAWSPDDRSIMCLAGDAPFFTSGAFHLVEIDLSTGSERSLSGPRWAWQGSLTWSADKRNLFVGASEHSDDALQIWRVSYPDAKSARITNDLSNYSRISRTSDSRTLLAVRHERLADLWVMPAGDQHRAVQISSGDLHRLNSAHWTTGGRIVYTAQGGTSRSLWSMDGRGGNRSQLTNAAFDQSEAAVSRDGRYIVCTSQGRIWRVNADGSDPRSLTRGPLDVHPVVSADGRSVVYVSFSGWSPGIGGQARLWRVSIDGGQPMQLTSDTNTLPDISPDGQWIACSFFRDDEPDRPPAIAIYPIGGGSAQKIFDRPPGSEHQVAWTADGKALDYIVNRGGVGNIWRQSRSGGPPAPITSFTSQMIFFFAYSPDGNTAVLGRGKDADDLVVITDAK